MHPSAHSPPQQLGKHESHPTTPSIHSNLIQPLTTAQLKRPPHRHHRNSECEHSPWTVPGCDFPDSTPARRPSGAGKSSPCSTGSAAPAPRTAPSPCRSRSRTCKDRKRVRLMSRRGDEHWPQVDNICRRTLRCGLRDVAVEPPHIHYRATSFMDRPPPVYTCQHLCESVCASQSQEMRAD